MDTLNNYETQMENIVNENAAMISRCEARIEELKAEIEKSGADMVKATETVDTAAFKVAKKRKDDAQIELDMLQNSLVKLKEEPLLKVEDFETMLGDLYAEQEKYTESKKKKYAPMVREMLADKKAAGELDDRIEKDLRVLLKEVMRFNGSRDKKYPKELEKYKHHSSQLDSYPIYWFLNNLENAAEEIGIE